MRPSTAKPICWINTPNAVCLVLCRQVQPGVRLSPALEPRVDGGTLRCRGLPLTSADGTVLRPVADDDGVRECAGDGAPLPAPLFMLARPSAGGFIAKLGPASDTANGFGDRTVPWHAQSRAARDRMAYSNGVAA